MRRTLVILITLLMVTISAFAQTQQGVVKTKGRMVNGKLVAGQGLPEATITVKGRNSAVSNSKGLFSLAIPSGNYYIQEVRKNGYVLADPDILSQRYTYSSSPLILVLETPEMQNRDRLNVASNVRNTIYRQYLEKEAELSKLLAEKKILQTEYDRQKSILDSIQKGNEYLVDEMAKRYAQMDFDQLDDFNRRVCEFIINGDLVKADSMLRTKGDVLCRIAEFERHKAIVRQETDAMNQRNKRLAESKEYLSQEQNDLARDCYSLFEVKKLQQQYDSAAYFIEHRANLDTTIVEWQIEAGSFLKEYAFEEYNYETSLPVEEKILGYYYRALSCADSIYGADSPLSGLCYRCIGDILDKYADPREDSLSNYKEALRIATLNFGPNSLEVAECLRKLAWVYSHQYNYMARYNPFSNEAEECAKRAYEIFCEKYGEYHYETAVCCAEVGESQYFYDNAFPYFNKALAILDSLGKGSEAAKAEVFIKKADHLYYGVEKRGSADSQTEFHYQGFFENYLSERLDQLTDSTGQYIFSKFTTDDCEHYKDFQEGVKELSIDRLNDYEKALINYRQAADLLVTIFGESYPRVIYVKSMIDEAEQYKEIEEDLIREIEERINTK